MHNSYSLRPIESLDESGHFAGYASIFHTEDRQHDVVLPGAFSASINAKPIEHVSVLWQHNWQEPIGVVTQLFEDATGLYIEGQLLLEVAKAREVHSLLRARAVSGLSIGYQPLRHRTNPDTGVRYLEAVELFEISLVTLPAHPDARVSVVKAYDAQAQEIRDCLAACNAAYAALMTR